MSVVFYPARDYLPLVQFGVFRRGGVPKTLILSNEQVDAVAGPTMLRDAMCIGETSVGRRGFEIGAFRLDVTRSRRRLVYTSTLSTVPYLYNTSTISHACLVLCNYNCAITL